MTDTVKSDRASPAEPRPEREHPRPQRLNDVLNLGGYSQRGGSVVERATQLMERGLGADPVSAVRAAAAGLSRPEHTLPTDRTTIIASMRPPGRAAPNDNAIDSALRRTSSSTVDMRNPTASTLAAAVYRAVDSATARGDRNAEVVVRVRGYVDGPRMIPGLSLTPLTEYARQRDVQLVFISDRSAPPGYNAQLDSWSALTARADRAGDDTASRLLEQAGVLLRMYDQVYRSANRSAASLHGDGSELHKCAAELRSTAQGLSGAPDVPRAVFGEISRAAEAADRASRGGSDAIARWCNDTASDRAFPTAGRIFMELLHRAERRLDRRPGD